MSEEIARLTVHVRPTSGGPVLQPVGDVELTTIHLLEGPLMEAVTETLAGSDNARLTVDLRRVEFIDSAGLSALVSARKRLALASRVLRVLLASGKQPDRVFQLGRFDTIMTLAYPPDG